MNKKFAAIGLSAGLAAGVGAGLILEASGSAGASSRIAATATTDGSTDSSGSATVPGADAALPDPTSHLQTVLQPLVDDGTITQAQADKVIAALVAAHDNDGDGPMGPMGGGRMGGHGPGGMDDHGGMGRGGAQLDTVATAIGITADEVRTGIESGQTIADLAVANGKTAQQVIDALVADATTRINQAVTDGKITQAEADTKLADATTRITDFVNNTPQFGPGHGPHGDDGDDDDAMVPADSSTVTTTAG